MEFLTLSCILDVTRPGINEQQWTWQQLQLASGPVFLLSGMGPGQAAALPGRSLHAGPDAWAAGDRWSRHWQDRPVHRSGVAHFEGRDGSRAGTSLPGVSLLPEGRPKEYGLVEVCPGPGGAA